MSWLAFVATLTPSLLLSHPPLRRLCRPAPPTSQPLRTSRITAAQERYYTPLATPEEYAELLATACNDTVSVIRFTAPWCRTCMAARPKLDQVAKRWPDASFYSLELVRNGKRAGERMNAFFKEQNAFELPHVEVYVGSRRVEALTLPPSRVELLQKSLAALGETLLGSRLRRERRNRRALLDKLKRAREWAAEDRERLLASLPAAATRRSAAATSRSWPPEAGRSRAPSRAAAPQRGATGGRRKGFRGGGGGV